MISVKTHHIITEAETEFFGSVAKCRLNSIYLDLYLKTEDLS